MDVISRPCRQPLLYFRVLVGPIVVENQMDVHAGAHGLVDPVEEPQELLMPVPRLAFSDHGPFQHVQRGE